MANTHDHGPCLASTWTIEHRNAGMETLSKLTQQNRDAQALQRVLAKGSPPLAPRLTVSSLLWSLFLKQCGLIKSGSFI